MEPGRAQARVRDDGGRVALCSCGHVRSLSRPTLRQTDETRVSLLDKRMIVLAKEARLGRRSILAIVEFHADLADKAHQCLVQHEPLIRPAFAGHLVPRAPAI